MNVVLANPVPSPPLNLPVCPSTDSCTCYTPQQTRNLADGIRDLRLCREQLDSTKRFLKVHGAKQQALYDWYQEPAVIVGGMVVSFTLGYTLAYYALAR